MCHSHMWEFCHATHESLVFDSCKGGMHPVEMSSKRDIAWVNSPKFSSVRLWFSVIWISCKWAGFPSFAFNSTQLNSKVFISRNIQYRSIATWDWNPHWFICPIAIDFKKFNLTSVLNTNWLVHVHTQKHTQNIVLDKYFMKKNRSFYTCKLQT